MMIKNMRSTSVDISSTNLKSNLSHNNMNFINQKNKELNMNFVNNNFIDKNEKNKIINGSLSNPNRDKISYKFKDNTGITASMLMKKIAQKEKYQVFIIVIIIIVILCIKSVIILFN